MYSSHTATELNDRELSTYSYPRGIPFLPTRCRHGIYVGRQRRSGSSSSSNYPGRGCGRKQNFRRTSWWQAGATVSMFDRFGLLLCRGVAVVLILRRRRASEGELVAMVLDVLQSGGAWSSFHPWCIMGKTMLKFRMYSGGHTEFSNTR